MMKKTLYVLTLISLNACQSTTSNQSQERVDTPKLDTLAIIKDAARDLNIQTKSFIEIDSSGLIILPLIIGDNTENGKNITYPDTPKSNFWNLLFYDSTTGQSHLLSERKMLFRSNDYSYGNLGNDYLTNQPHHLFYKIRVDDFNKDGNLSSTDPLYLFVSDKKGNGFRQISPDGYNLISWEYIKSTKKVIMILAKDSDGNLKFEESDEVKSFEVNLNTKISASEVISGQLKNQLKLLFEKHWNTKNPQN